MTNLYFLALQAEVDRWKAAWETLFEANERHITELEWKDSVIAMLTRQIVILLYWRQK